MGSNILRYFSRVLSFSEHKNLYGSAKWMKFVERWKFLSPFQRGLSLGKWMRLSLTTSYRGNLVVAPPGSGKSTAFIIPNLLMLHSGASSIVTDPSGELHHFTSGYLSRTHKIHILNFSDVERSLRYNPLLHIKTLEELHIVSDILASHSNPNDADQFWTTGASQLIYSVLAALRNQSQQGSSEGNTLVSLRAWIEKIHIAEKEDAALRGFLIQHLSEEQYGTYASLIQKDEKVLMGYVATALTSLDLRKEANYDVSRITTHSTLRIPSLRQTPSVVYLIVKEHEIKRLSLILKLFYFQCFRIFTEHSKGSLPLFFLLDEFGNIGRIPYFSEYLNTVRKRNISVTVVLQSLKQLEVHYGQGGAATILEGLGNKVFLPGIQCLDTLRYAETLLGTRTGYDSTRETEVAVPLMRLSEIRTLNDQEALLVSGNKLPVKFSMNPYYRDRDLQRRSRLEPVYPEPPPGGMPETKPP